MRDIIRCTRPFPLRFPSIWPLPLFSPADVIFQQIRMRKVPEFIDVKHLVTFVYSLLDFRGTFALQGSLVVYMNTRIRFAHQKLGQLILNAGRAKRESQFVTVSA